MFLEHVDKAIEVMNVITRGVDAFSNLADSCNRARASFDARSYTQADTRAAFNRYMADNDSYRSTAASRLPRDMSNDNLYQSATTPRFPRYVMEIMESSLPLNVRQQLILNYLRNHDQ